MVMAISIENLGKKYRLGQVHTYLLSERIGNGLRSYFRKFRDGSSVVNSDQKSSGDELWALKDLNMEIQEGEVIGIIGKNGAGKSTLLKILSRITEPTTGHITYEGRVGSLLEVGTGFHQELTGRENIFLNGAILGMSRAEITKKFDEIVNFSEIERFLDTPVKRYSSGMYVRLGFAVAAHLEPEILIVDEVLAVGDVQFQKKCLGKMENVAKEGRTVLFVSHNMTAIRDLCKRAVWLDSGRCVGDGEVNAVVSRYLQENANSIHEAVWEDPRTAPGNQKVRLHRARLSVPREFSSITIRTPLDAEFEYWNFVPDAKLSLSLHLYNLEGMCIFNSDSTPRNYPIGLIRDICHIPGDLLNDGTYKIKIMVVQENSFGIYDHEDILVFDVHEGERDSNWYGKWPGAVRPKLNWTTEFINPPDNNVLV